MPNDQSKISLGGSAANNGVLFLSDTYTAKFTMQDDDTYAITTGKRPLVGSCKDKLRHIPLLKGLGSLLDGPPFFVLTIGLLLTLDICRSFLIHSAFLDQIVPVPVLVAFVAVGVAALAFHLKTLLRILFGARRTWAFHGAEHKAIYAYTHDIELELDRVRACPRVASRCGTNLLVFFIPLYLLFMFTIPYGSARIILAYVLAYEMFDLENGKDLPILKHFFRVGFWFQDRLFTLEPSDAQLSASMETLKVLVDLEQGHQFSALANVTGTEPSATSPST